MISFEPYSIPENTLETFRRLFSGNMFPHASILIGDDAKKLTAVSRELAAALVCSEKDAPCGSCPNCIKSRSNMHPDIRVVAPREKRKSVNMDESREMIMDTFIMPNEAQRKVYIIESAHTLDEKVQNSLLKTLEEPPQYAYFILNCLNSSAMLGTVMSRVSAFSVGSGDESGEDEKADEIALGIVRALFEIDEIELLKATAELDRDRRLTAGVMERFIALTGEAIRAKQGAGSDSTGMAARFTSEELFALKSAADSIYDAAQRNANEKLLITLLSSRFRRAIGG
jgi:DNA polymerase-3 subunit delta'